jgi:hypothetical protein
VIPKIIHSIWIGPLPTPRQMIDSWAAMNPGWEHRVWRDHTGWRNQALIDALPEWNGKADVMRVEILERFGGVHVDADSIAVAPLGDSLLDCDCFLTAENETCRPGTLSGAFMGSVPGGAFIRECVEKIGARDPKVIAWKSVGPDFLTGIAKGHPELVVLPSGCFFPMHYTGAVGVGGPTYGEHVWGNTTGSYERPAGVSCVICCKGISGQWLGHAVASVRTQSVRVDEIVCVCADDESARLANGLGCRVLRDPGVNRSTARNIGIRAASHFTIFCLDADDTLHPQWLAKTLPHAKRTRFVVGTSMQNFGDEVGVYHWPPFAMILAENPVGSCALFSRELFDVAGGYDETLSEYEDWEFWIRCFRCAPTVAMVREPLYNYRRHAGQAMARVRREGLDAQIRAEIRRRHPALYGDRT